MTSIQYATFEYTFVTLQMPLVGCPGCLKIKSLSLYIHDFRLCRKKVDTTARGIILQRPLGQNSENDELQSHDQFQLFIAPDACRWEEKELPSWYPSCKWIP